VYVCSLLSYNQCGTTSRKCSRLLSDNLGQKQNNDTGTIAKPVILCNVAKFTGRRSACCA